MAAAADRLPQSLMATPPRTWWESQKESRDRGRACAEVRWQSERADIACMDAAGSKRRSGLLSELPWYLASTRCCPPSASCGAQHGEQPASSETPWGPDR
jgi:hypothetical protein